MGWINRVGGRKLIGFFSCLAVGGVLIYVERFDETAALYISGLFGLYVGGNAGNAVAACIRSFAENRHPPANGGGELPGKIGDKPGGDDVDGE